MFEDFTTFDPLTTRPTLSNVVGFFRMIWNGLARTIQLIISIPGLLITSVAGLTTGIVNVVSFCLQTFDGQSSQWAFVQNAVTNGADIISGEIASNGWLSIGCYVLNVKGFITCLGSLPLLIIAVFWVFIQYVVTVLLPVLLGILVYRIGVKIAKAIAPEGYAPCLEIDVPMLEEVYGGNSADWDFVP